MSNEMPENSLELLSILYMKNHDLSGKSPEELYALYVETYIKFKAISSENPEKPEKQEIEVFKRPF